MYDHRLQGHDMKIQSSSWASFLEEIVDSSNGVETDAVNFSNHRFVFFVRPRHYLFAQAAQLGQVRLQLGGQDCCLLLGTHDEIFLLLNALLGGSDFSLEVF
jgi:hypothetical protein